MARHKNATRDIPAPLHGYDGAQLAALMDIRDELQTLNRLLGCPNFTRIPAVLDKIAKNTMKRKRKAVTR